MQIFFSVRLNPYRYYVLYVACYALLQGTLLGFNYQFLWPQVAWLNNISVPILLSAVVFFVCRFTNSFLSLDTELKRVHLALNGLAFIALFNIALTFVTPLQWSMGLGLIVALVSVVIIISTGLYLWCWLKKKSAAYFTLAWLAFLFGSFLQILSLFQVLADNAITSNLAQLGSLVELLMLSFGLVEKFRQDREERERVEKEANRALIKLNNLLSDTTDKLNVSNKIKGEFLSTISHELRTPMNGIIGGLELLRDHIKDQEAKECFEMANQSSERMMTMVDSILQFVSLQAEASDIQCERFKVQTLFEALKSFAKDIADDKAIVFEFESADPCSIVSHFENLLAIMKELLKNAHKFTPQGNIKIGVDFGSKDKIGLYVEDNGVGIEPEKLKLIFDSFSQGEQSMSRAHDGLGIGLALAKSFATVIKAEITVESIVNQGSRFTVWVAN